MISFGKQIENVELVEILKFYICCGFGESITVRF